MNSLKKKIDEVFFLVYTISWNLLLDFKEWLWNNYTQDENFWQVNPYGWKRWEAVLNHMNSEDHSDLLPGFREYIGHIDGYRKLDFKSVFPELSHLV